jgi:acetoin utilization protein AcuB
MFLSEIMSKPVVTVEFDDRLREVKEIFDRLRFHHLLVVDNGKLFGVVSDRDLLKALSPFIGTLSETERDVHTLDRRVHQIMSRRPVTLRPDDRVAAAIELFLQRGISCVPIVDEHNRPVGIVSWRDILRVVAPP